MPEEETTQTETRKGEETKFFTQEQVNSLLAEQKRTVQSKYTDYDDIKAKASQFDELSEQQKTEQQKLTDRLAAIEKERDDAAAERDKANTARLVSQKAADAGLPSRLWKRVSGTTAEEIDADIADLMEGLSIEDKKKSSSFKSGASKTETAATSKERAAAALRQFHNQ